MKDPVLVILAAGMGSRYGGLKQMDPVGPNGEIIIDYALHDARRAGFKKVVFIIKEEIAEDFFEVIGDRTAEKMEVAYAYQEMDKIPAEYSVPEGRNKPWGTTHAVLCAEEAIDGAPFAVCNADDYYGPQAYEIIYKYLDENREALTDGSTPAPFAMVGYRLKNTVSDHGSVARGVCNVNDEGRLTGVTEMTKIEKVDGEIVNNEDPENPVVLDPNSLVSMNFWGYGPSFIENSKTIFDEFLRTEVPANPAKSEIYLPTTTDQMIREGSATVDVLESEDRWFGVTYREDKEHVSSQLKALHDSGVYQDVL